MIQPLLGARAEIGTKSRCFFGGWENLVFCFQYLLTFIKDYNYVNYLTLATSINDVWRFFAFFTYLCPISSDSEKGTYLMTSHFFYPTLLTLLRILFLGQIGSISYVLPIRQNIDILNRDIRVQVKDYMKDITCFLALKIWALSIS